MGVHVGVVSQVSEFKVWVMGLYRPTMHVMEQRGRIAAATDQPQRLELQLLPEDFYVVLFEVVYCSRAPLKQSKPQKGLH